MTRPVAKFDLLELLYVPRLSNFFKKRTVIIQPKAMIRLNSIALIGPLSPKRTPLHLFHLS
jgi:hypothetical protein